MTGFGDGRCDTEQLTATAEVRAVNNRYLKILTKCPEGFAPLEAEIEKLVRATVARGTVSVTVNIDQAQEVQRYRLRTEVVRGYWRDLHYLSEELRVAMPADMSSLLPLPGAVAEESLTADPESNWPPVRDALQQALAAFQEFRSVEGRSMEQELRLNCDRIAEQTEKVAETAPAVVAEYRNRLHERVRDLLVGSEARVESGDLIREVSIFADRCDVTEEVARLRSHLEQFAAFLGDEMSLGRKLEFLTQEMHRETNTIGSKANSIDIAHAVVEMKASIEKMREILQNVE